MRLTQMLAVLNGEVPRCDYNRLSHYDPYLYWGNSKEDEQMNLDESVNGSAYCQALIEICRRRGDCPS